MINSLPVEIILGITSYLSVNDKCTLIRTCRRLYDIISKRNLFDRLDLTAGKYPVISSSWDLEIVLQKFENKHLDGSQVKTLCTSLDIYDERPPSRLSTVFPNVTRVITHLGIFSRFGHIPPYTLSEPMLTWANTIEIHNSFSDWYDIREALRLCVFPRLKELELGISKYFKDQKEGFNTLRFLPYIKNVPSLTKLTLRECDIDLKFLEALHSSCPLLNTLVIKSAVIINREPLSHAISPASSFIHLEMENVTMLDRDTVFLNYILLKYPNLQYLEFNRNERDSDAEEIILESYPIYKDIDLPSSYEDSEDEAID